MKSVSYLAGRIRVWLAVDKLTFPPNQSLVALMEDERNAKALNLLGENADLFFNRKGLLDLIGEYFDNHTTEGKLRSSLLSHPAILLHYMNIHIRMHVQAKIQ